MNNHDILELYTDYLLTSFSYTTATSLSDLLDGQVSHDQVTRFLASEDFDSKKLWQTVKKDIREIEDKSGVLIFDETGFSLTPSTPYAWQPKGKATLEIPSSRSQRLNLLGFMNRESDGLFKPSLRHLT